MTPLAPLDPAITDITRAMATAIAPVFLITGAGTLLSAMAIRYARVIDRARTVLAIYRTTERDREGVDRLDQELRALYRRARLLRLTIILNAAAIFCVALCIFLIFGGIMVGRIVPYVVPSAFMLSLLLLILSLGFFIEDFAISLSGLKYEIRTSLQRDIFAGHADEPMVPPEEAG